MSSPHDSFQDFLESLSSQGRSSGEGRFTLNAARATEMLREQGRLGRNAPLYLLAAIHTHTGGDAVRLTTARTFWQLSWEQRHGRLAATLEQEIASAALAARGVTLKLTPHAVELHPASLLEPLFEEVASRLAYYPWQIDSGQSSTQPRIPWRTQPQPMEKMCLGSRLYDDGVRLQLQRPEPGWPARWLHVVSGVVYPRRSSLPVDVLCFDPLGRPDLSLETIPDASRPRQLEAVAVELFLERIDGSLQGVLPYRLDPGGEPEFVPLFALYAAYATSQRVRPELAEKVAQTVRFVDVAGRDWTLGELLELHSQQGALMTIDGNFRASALTRQAGDAPVLLWGGLAQRIGETLFSTLLPGAGYLYSLAVNEKEREQVGRGEPLLARSQVKGGWIGLLPWGEADRTAELEFIGPRRARETLYLDSAAPKGLRLHWESDRQPQTVAREVVLEPELRQAVLELLDVEAATLPVECLLSALTWAALKDQLDWSRLANTWRRPLFETVGGELLSAEQLQRSLQRGERLAVLGDRSSSLPDRLPCQPLLWNHSCFEALGWPVEEVGPRVRQAYWQELGRERWLAAHAPAPPLELPGALSLETHWVAPQASPERPTEVLFWREGRPFGRRLLPPSVCPAGCRVTWVEDELPADSYWSGPDPAAVEARIPAIAALCVQAIDAFGVLDS